MKRDDEGLLRSQLRTAREQQKVVDVSGRLADLGKACRCEVATNLMTSLVWEYPNAMPLDFVPLDDLLSRVLEVVDQLRQPRDQLVCRSLGSRTWWMGPHAKFNLLLLYRKRWLESITLLPPSDPCCLFDYQRPPLPATLLVRLMLTLLEVESGEQAVRSPLVRRVRETLQRLVRCNPWQLEIAAYLEVADNPFEVRARDESGEQTLGRLLEQLEFTAAVAQMVGAEIWLPVSTLLEHLANLVLAVPGDRPCGPRLGKRPVH